MTYTLYLYPQAKYRKHVKNVDLISIFYVIIKTIEKKLPILKGCLSEAATSQIRYTGKTAKATWMAGGVEQIAPYRYYNVLYLDGVKTTVVNYTDKKAKAEWKQESINKNTGEYVVRLYLEGKKTAVTTLKMGEWRLEGSSWTKKIGEYTYTYGNERLYVEGNKTSYTRTATISSEYDSPYDIGDYVTVKYVRNVLWEKIDEYAYGNIIDIDGHKIQISIIRTDDSFFNYGDAVWFEDYMITGK